MQARPARPRRGNFVNGMPEFDQIDGETPFQKSQRERQQTYLLYSFSLGLAFLGLCYAAVPLYRLFCAKTGYGGTAAVDPGGTHAGQFAPDRLVAATGKRARPIKVRFMTDCADALPWKFSASQSSVSVVPGETALAFFTAHNTTDKDIIGVATYTVTPGQVRAEWFDRAEEELTPGADCALLCQSRVLLLRRAAPPRRRRGRPPRPLLRRPRLPR